ncbi:ArgJ family protein [Sphaeroforma arctica JP610]|uniref:Arginine biosynthesis bifunctional protein ArgJ, mitochondrial n=1 Tax=Sphaeroforma arctica JP610 TaxID=667725 RepID=A0A0L0G814_9EUKA|nr:ArgJ family protein [Sphaeroforma arctica JP610]KNC85167.1 ArgJ family protein [Sphaeroforma arctica JP610]|eukprot:XP_014159069.1 ArgJ family protein [Sphaeroforma arctica JP610]
MSAARAPLGFLAGSVHCGLKKNNAKDLAAILSLYPCTAAGVFTKNKFRAAPVLVCEANLKDAPSAIGGVLINSGCANACTGDQGLKDAHAMDQLCRDISIGANRQKPSLVLSTGVIGQPLDLAKIEKGTKQLATVVAESEDGWNDAAMGIMTTDTYHKFMTTSLALEGPYNTEVRFAGIAKGAGMIHPNMATMLGIVATDANISAALLKKICTYAADRSFNCISVDGDTSTNDSFVILANGAACEQQIVAEDDQAYLDIRAGVTGIAKKLARELVRDGEGATKFVSIIVEEARHYEDARIAAVAIATSMLVKTALFGQDANWGRIVCALGYSGAEFNGDNVNLHLSSRDDNGDTVDSLHLFKNGQPFEIDEERAAEILKHREIDLRLNVGENADTETLTYWTTDLTYDYIKINADYRS